MIYLLLIIDVLINNFTKYTSYFFIIFLYKKKYKYYLLTGLILDIVIFNTYFYNIVLLSIMYLFNKIFKNLNKFNIYNFIFINTFNYIIYIIGSNLLVFENLYNILILLGSNLILNLIFYILSYRAYLKVKL